MIQYSSHVLVKAAFHMYLVMVNKLSIAVAEKVDNGVHKSYLT